MIARLLCVVLGHRKPAHWRTQYNLDQTQSIRACRCGRCGRVVVQHQIFPGIWTGE